MENHVVTYGENMITPKTFSTDGLTKIAKILLMFTKK